MNIASQLSTTYAVATTDPHDARTVLAAIRAKDWPEDERRQVCEALGLVDYTAATYTDASHPARTKRAVERVGSAE